MPKVEHDAEVSIPTELEINRRSILMSSGSLLALAATGTIAAEAQAQAPPPAAARTGSKPNIVVIMGDDVGWFNLERLSSGHHVGEDAEPRQARRGRHAVHRLLRRGQLHGGPGKLHHRRDPVPRPA